MDDLISRASALNAIDCWHIDFNTMDGAKVQTDCWRSIKELPAVDAVPVVHGRWIEYPLCLGYAGAYSEDHIVCSNCKSVWSIIDNDTERFDYCPHCGARMDGERRDGEDGSA